MTAAGLRLALIVGAGWIGPGLRAAPPGVEQAVVASLPPYEPREAVTGTIRLWGHGSTKIDFMGKLVQRWEAGFARFQPAVKFDYRMYGTASAIGALYTGAGDLALMGEEVFPFEAAAYERVMRMPAPQVEIATGSLDVRNFDFAQIFFVHRDNPISRMTLAQVDAIFGTEHLRGAPRNFRTWGDLGLTGEWTHRPIHLYGWAFDNDFWIYLRQEVFGGSHRWNNALREYSHIPRPDGTIYDAGQQILEALARDPDGIALSNLRYANPRVKPLALAAQPGGPFFEATKENLIERSYPLTRIIPAVFNLPAGQAIDPKVREFLRYILSREGQGDIVADGEYLPLNRAAVFEQLGKLAGPGEAVPGAGPPVASAKPEAGTIRICGDDRMESVVKNWEEGFQKENPGARFENKLMGTGTGMAGVYSGVADLAILGREITPVETMAFAWVYRYPPAAVEVATGSLDVPGKSPALAVLVSSDNPVSHLTLAQLDAIFGCERRRGAPGQIRTWGDLGLTGEWADRPIHAYGRDVDTGTAGFFRQAVLKGSRKWNWDELTEFTDKPQPDGSVLDADRQIASALAADRFGIAVSSLHYPDPRVKAVALAEGDGGPYFGPTRDNLIAREYPLTRSIGAYFNRAPGQAIDPKVDRFLRYILSQQGQGDVAREGDYLPLSADKIQEQLGKLGAADRVESRTAEAAPPYRPRQSVSGVIRLWGHGNIALPWMRQLVTFWETGFRRYHPGVTVRYEMHGTSSAIPALYTGVGDLSILGEEIDPDAVAAFAKVKGYPPVGIDLMTGSLDVRNFDFAQMFFVHKDNPLRQLTLAQLDGIFGEEHRRGPENIRTWGQLGLEGDWADKPITPYGWRIDDSFGIYLQQALLNGSHRWNCALREFAHIPRPDGTIYDHGQQILDALAHDRYLKPG